MLRVFGAGRGLGRKGGGGFAKAVESLRRCGGGLTNCGGWAILRALC